DLSRFFQLRRRLRQRPRQLRHPPLLPRGPLLSSSSSSSSSSSGSFASSTKRSTVRTSHTSGTGRHRRGNTRSLAPAGVVSAPPAPCHPGAIGDRSNCVPSVQLLLGGGAGSGGRRPAGLIVRR
ncbi:unnamed protein product, partial [Ectocarpus fasciculatus]